jgi:hypothetical protein
MNKDWMPINPCPCGCIRYPDSHKCNAEDDGCTDLAKYEGAVEYQKKLLGYLKWHQYSKGINKGLFEIMLKELEAK